jgi:hypothetical protein
LIVDRDSGDEGYLVLRAPSRGAADEFNAEVGVVDLHGSAQHRGGLALDHPS